MKHHSNQAVQVRLLFQPPDFHVLESVICEQGLEGFQSIATECIAIQLYPVLTHDAEISEKNRPVQIAHLAILQLNGIAGLSAELETAVARYILVEREDVDARRRFSDRHGFEFLRCPDRLIALPDQFSDFQISALRLRWPPS